MNKSKFIKCFSLIIAVLIFIFSLSSCMWSSSDDQTVPDITPTDPSDTDSSEDQTISDTITIDSWEELGDLDVWEIVLLIILIPFFLVYEVITLALSLVVWILIGIWALVRALVLSF